MSSTIHSSEIESMADGPKRTFVMSMDPDVLLDDGDSSSFSVIEDDSSEDESDEGEDEEAGEEWSLSNSQMGGVTAREHTSGGGFSLRSGGGGGGSFSKIGSTTTTASPSDQVTTVAEGGTKIVNRYRYFVVISFVAVSLALSLTTRVILSHQKSQTDRGMYDWIATTVHEGLQNRVATIEANVQWLAETMHSSSIDSQAAFTTVADHLRSTVLLEAIFVVLRENTTLWETNITPTFTSPEVASFSAYESTFIEDAIQFFESNKDNTNHTVAGIHSSMNETGHHCYVTPIKNHSGIVMSTIAWETLLEGLLPEPLNGIVAVIGDTCGTTVAYDVSSSEPLVNNANEHIIPDTKITGTLVSSNSTEFFCGYSLSIYASDLGANSSFSFHGVLWTIVSMSFLTILVFCIYDRIVQQRHLAILHAAARSNALISSLFPTNFRDRLFEEVDNEADAETRESRKSDMNGSSSDPMMAAMQGINDDDDDPVAYKGKPIADLFPETTILFADIAGFTAWSSVREPSQVFILLETLYHAFDTIAKQRGVFKVETVGDCYVAATGLPEPRADHAVAMCRFANECMNRTNVLTKRLEVLLGPDTADLTMRMGIHSGPVTAGVLRGERSRFQLFGDTMNTAARMEHNGLRDRIQLSQETADLLIEAGKTNWLERREDLVYAKGKGEMQTYFLDMSKRSSSQVDTSSNPDSMEETAPSSPSGDDIPNEMFDSKTKRLVGWCVDVLLKLLKQIEARRRATAARESELPNEALFHAANRENHGVLDEIKEIIALPKFQEVDNQEDSDSITLRPEVAQELQSFVAHIASMYKPNYFHNFEHASHVTMSVVKLLARIVAPKECANGDLSSLHDHTYGITSDPLTQFACVLSALIHDADHKGVSNMQLVKEQDPVATKYNNKSVLEQNSIDLAWDLLMTDEYKNLRRTIYQTDAELLRFRQLLVNSVMATDISDKELKTLRNLRWERAFKDTTDEVFNERDTINRKATIVIEHLIQASDVSHTMQHWHVYRKWNERFFMECYQAYKDGRADTDPSVGWYKGEIGFFDFYIIPLARKLKECGVFGVSSAEYLNYAVHNRQEWEARGKEVVDEMLEKVK